MHIVLDIQGGSSQCATLFICATSIYGSWIRETKRIQIRIRISEFEFAIQLQLPPILGATGGNSNNCAAIYAIQFVRWPQTLTKFFDLQNYFYDGAGNDCWYHFRQLPSPLPLTLPTPIDWHLKWTQIVCVRFIDAHPSDTTAFDQARRWQRRRRTCLSALCMTVCVCVCPTQPAGLSAENTYLNVNRFWMPTVAAIPADLAVSCAPPACRLQPRWLWSTPNINKSSVFIAQPPSPSLPFSLSLSCDLPKRLSRKSFGLGLLRIHSEWDIVIVIGLCKYCAHDVPLLMSRFFPFL